MIGWLILFFSPLFPVWSDRIAGIILPILLSLAYVGLLVASTSESNGGFGTLAEVMDLFSYEQAALMGWIHFLAFDLFIGAWVCRKARSEGMRFWLVILCLPLIFIFGPAGFVAFQATRAICKRKTPA